MLTALSQVRAFIVYRASDKCPVNTDGQADNAQNPALWMLPQEAQAWAAAFGDGYGVGIVLHPALPIFCVDIDGALQPDGQWSPLARAFCVRFAGCAMEVSLSGRGLHIFGSYRGEMPAHKTKNGALHIEMYHEARYIALTGTNAVGSVLFDATHLLPQFIAEYFTATVDDAKPGEWTHGPVPQWDGPTDDNVLIARALKSKSTAAVFSGKASFEDLWTANPERLCHTWPPNDTSRAAYDESSADMALANHLAFWTGNDCQRMFDLMAQSGLRREKWETRPDYLANTILEACARQRNWAGSTGSAKPVAMPAGPLTAIVYADASTAPPQQAPPPPTVEGAPPVPTAMPGPTAPNIGPGSFLFAHGQAVLFTGCTYVQDVHQVMTPTGVLLDQKRFDVEYGRRTYAMRLDGTKPSDSAWDAFTDGQTAVFPKVRGTFFEPREVPGATLLREGQQFINSWMPVEIRAIDGDVTPFLAHLQKLFPQDWRTLLNYLKFMVQRKGEKSMWWPFLQGVPGNGKSFISDTMQYCVGLRYTQKPTPKNMDGQFNASLYGCLFLAFEDVKVREDYGAMWETLKPMITGPRLEIQPKGVDKITREVCFNGILNSNHKSGIKKESDDRRIAPFFAAQQRRRHLARDGLTKQYFDALWAWAQADGWAHVAYYLATDPIDLDAQFVEAPLTSCTAEHIALSLGPAEQELLEQVKVGAPGFAGGWVNSVKFDHLLQANGYARKIPRAGRGDVLEALGYQPHPGLPEGRVSGLTDGSGAPILYVCEGHTTHAWTDPQAIRQAYETAQRVS